MRGQHYLYPAERYVQADIIAQTATVAMLFATAAPEFREAGKANGKYQSVEVFDPENMESSIWRPTAKHASKVPKTK